MYERLNKPKQKKSKTLGVNSDRSFTKPYSSENSPFPKISANKKNTFPILQSKKKGEKYGSLPGDLQNHMKGIWDGKEKSSVTGGHWLPGMKSKWSENVKLDGADDGQSEGIYFSALPKKSGNLPGFTHGILPSWYIRKGGKTSGIKDQSSFWPPNWGWSDFVTHLSNSSLTKDDGHVWKTTTYNVGTIEWDSTSSNGTAYPTGFEYN